MGPAFLKSSKRPTAFFVMATALIAALGPAFAADSCFIGLEINEEKSGESTLFSLDSVSSLYGNYGGNVVPSYPGFTGQFTLKALDGEGNVLQEHALFSSRFAYWDSLEPITGPGELFEEEDSGLINAVIPYDSAISRLVVDDAGTETDLGFDPGLAGCGRTCKLEGETGLYNANESCCSGLIKINKYDGSFVCVNCGDGLCSENEDHYSCFEDCSLNLSGGCLTLDEEGRTYYLPADVEDNGLTGPCMKVTAPNVTLDCSGYSIRSSSAVAGVYSDQPYTTVRNCNIQMGPGGYAAGADGIFLLRADNSQILNNNLSNNYRGIMVASSKNVRVEGNTVNNNAVEGITVYDMTYDGVYDCSDNVLSSNSFVGNGYFGISVQNPCPGTTLSGNFIEGTVLYSGIALGGDDSVIRDNISIRNEQSGISFSGNNIEFSGNAACGNNYSGHPDQFDAACFSAAFGSGNVFSTFRPCGTWPSSGDYAECSSEVNLVVENFGGTDCGTCNGADFDNDNDVDVYDLRMALASGPGSPVGEGRFVISSFALVPSSVSAPGSFDARVLVGNSGGEAANALVSVSVFSLDGLEAFSDSVSGNIEAGDSKSFSMPVPVDASWAEGNYRVTVRVSSLGADQASATKVLTVSKNASSLVVPELAPLVILLLLSLVLVALYYSRHSGKSG